MKKIPYLLVVLAAMTAMVSCNVNDDIENGQTKVKFTSGITATPQPRVATDYEGHSTWTMNDPIGISMVENGTTVIVEGADNIPYKATTTAASTVFTPSGTTIYYALSNPANVDFIAYHPYSSSVVNWVYPVDVSVQTPQTDIDLMWAKADNSGAGYDKTSTNVNFIFNHQLAKLIINVSKGAGVTGTVTDVNITGMNTSANFDLKGDDGLTDIGTPQVIVPYAADGTTYEAILLPVATLDATHTVTFTTSAGETYTWTMSDDIPNLAAGSLYAYDIVLTKHAVNVTGSISSWIVGTPGTGIAD